MGKPFADATQFDEFAESTDNSGPDDFPDPPQVPGFEAEDELEAEG